MRGGSSFVVSLTTVLTLASCGVKTDLITYEAWEAQQAREALPSTTPAPVTSPSPPHKPDPGKGTR